MVGSARTFNAVVAETVPGSALANCGITTAGPASVPIATAATHALRVAFVSFLTVSGPSALLRLLRPMLGVFPDQLALTTPNIDQRLGR